VVTVGLAAALAPRAGPASGPPSPGPAGAVIDAGGATPSGEPAASAPVPSVEPVRSPAASPSGPVGGSLVDLLARLEVASEDRTGYERDRFRHWIDADNDGCDTRREVLIDEALVAPLVGPGCRLTGGSWLSLYDGVRTDDPADLDIDHVVPLAEAWDSGASAWSDGRREAFANDLGVPWALIAVTDTSNRSKSDQDPADWLPPATTFTCPYVAMWIEVKVRWSLAVDPAELDALRPLAIRCADQPVAPVPTPAAS